MLMRILLSVFAAMLAFAPAAGAPQQTPYYVELLASKRVFPEVGPGLRALKRGPGDRYYVLTAPGASVGAYDSTGKHVGQIPAAAAPGASLVYGNDLDVDAAGHLYVADLGANAVRVYNADGTLALTIPIAAPTSVIALPEGELAVASTKSARLISVFRGPGIGAGNPAAAGKEPGNMSAPGRIVREFGDPTEITEHGELNRFLNVGRLATDSAGNIYYAFNYLPEPTVRRYDRNGYAAYAIELATLEFQPVAQAARREIQRQHEGHRSGPPALKPIITAVGVDPATQEVWVALGAVLLHFDREGNRRATYRSFTPEGARLETSLILVEPNRLLLGADPLGLYEFSRPDKARP